MSRAPTHVPTEVRRTVTLVNKRGLHARASAKFVQMVESFDAEVQVTSHNTCGEETVVADSIMELLMLGSACGEKITIVAKGPDAGDAIEMLAEMVEGGFDEEE